MFFILTHLPPNDIYIAECWFAHVIYLQAKTSFFCLFLLVQRKKERVGILWKGIRRSLHYLTSLFGMGTCCLCPFLLKGKPERCLKGKGGRIQTSPKPSWGQDLALATRAPSNGSEIQGNRSYFFSLIIYWMSILKTIKLWVYLWQLPVHTDCELFLTSFCSEHQHFK